MSLEFIRKSPWGHRQGWKHQIWWILELPPCYFSGCDTFCLYRFNFENISSFCFTFESPVYDFSMTGLSLSAVKILFICPHESNGQIEGCLGCDPNSSNGSSQRCWFLGPMCLLLVPRLRRAHWKAPCFLELSSLSLSCKLKHTHTGSRNWE